MIKPLALEPGAHLALVAPGSPFRRDEFDEGVEEIRRLGFVPTYEPSVFAVHTYVAGPAALRATALHNAWSDRNVRGLMAVRGGYGSAQVLPLLDPAVARAARKPLVGYSDITSILNWLCFSCGMVAFHGPMVAGRVSRGADGYDRDSLVRAVCGRAPVGELAPAGVEVVRAGEATGPLFGGTLTQLVSSLGTPFAFCPPPGYVLFLDEIGERPYRLDRMVTQLGQAGLLARAAAVVINELPKCDEPGGRVTGRGVMADLFAGFPGPVLIGFPSGHAVSPAITLPFGVSCRVVAGARPCLAIEEAAVE
jgi:muramoyltetrapeptide carboxypeptidase